MSHKKWPQNCGDQMSESENEKLRTLRGPSVGEELTDNQAEHLEHQILAQQLFNYFLQGCYWEFVSQLTKSNANEGSNLKCWTGCLSLPQPSSRNCKMIHRIWREDSRTMRRLVGAHCHNGTKIDSVAPWNECIRGR